MTEHNHKIVYLIVEKGANGNKQTFWRTAGVAYPCRDGSLNLKLDIHPNLTFNVREPKSNGERMEAAAEIEDAETEYHAAKDARQFPARVVANQAGQTIDRTEEMRQPEAEADEDGQVFPCDDCRIATDLDEAHLLSGGGAVCHSCGKKNYKPCGRCGYFYPKTINGTHCPLCKGAA